MYVSITSVTRVIVTAATAVSLIGCMKSTGILPAGDAMSDSSFPDSDAWMDVNDDSQSDAEAGCTSDDDCDDANPCTDDICLDGAECIHEPNESLCDDGNACTDPDVCADGTCQPGPGVCECESDADCLPFDDDDLCNGTLVCDGDLCAIDPGTIVHCPAPTTQCAPLVCQPSTGDCVVQPADPASPCEKDEDLCTADICDGEGACLHEDIDCDDDEECTDDACHPASGCYHTAISGPCEDGDICTEGDLCFGGSCSSGGPLDCDDGDPCTTDTCDSLSGCEASFNTGPCTDGDPCTGPDTCDGSGGCDPGPAVTVWYLDGDDDDFGLSTNPVCSPTRPPGYAPDPGDCCDGLDEVNPGQTAWFASPYYCPGGSGAQMWDYNCDGSNTNRWNVRGDCYWSSGTCRTTAGWDINSWDPIPGCGDIERYISACGTSTCHATTSDDRAQQCH